MNKLKLKFKQASHGVLSFRIKEKLLITGFWRSGTTWLQQSIQNLQDAQCVFEPFSPACGHVWPGFAKYDDDANHHIFMPMEMNLLRDADHRSLKKSFNGVAPNAYSYLLSEDFADALSRNIIVKSTRLGFVLPDILKQYPVKALHIRRHPAAVYCSMLNTNWSWQFPDVRFEKVYALHTGATSLIDTLMEHDQSVVARFAAFWALSEAQAQEAIDSDLAQLVRYEDLTENPDLLSTYFTGHSTPALPDSKTTNSPVTEENRKNLSAAQRANDWKDRISKNDLAILKDTILRLSPGLHAQYEW